MTYSLSDALTSYTIHDSNVTSVSMPCGVFNFPAKSAIDISEVCVAILLINHGQFITIHHRATQISNTKYVRFPLHNILSK